MSYDLVAHDTYILQAKNQECICSDAARVFRGKPHLNIVLGRNLELETRFVWLARLSENYKNLSYQIFDAVKFFHSAQTSL